jgi:hypothetical protein
MQTFLPFADFAASARVLDNRRLGKQRVEVLQVLRAITRPNYGWRHHPVPKMWRGFEEALGAYAVAVCREWCRRGHRDTCELTLRIELAELGIDPIRSQAELAAAGRLPPWLGDERLHRSHRSALVRKNAEYYEPLLPDADPDLEYFWPGRADDQHRPG